MGFLGRKLAKSAGKSGGGEGNGGGNAVFCYVNSVFAPGLDEGVGGLWRVSLFFFEFLFCVLFLGGGVREESRGRAEGSK